MEEKFEVSEKRLPFGRFEAIRKSLDSEGSVRASDPEEKSQ